MIHLTEAEALAIYDEKTWEHWPVEYMIEYQVNRDRFCVPLTQLASAFCVSLGREVTREEVFDSFAELRREYMALGIVKRRS